MLTFRQRHLGSPVREICTPGSAWGDETKRLCPLGEASARKRPTGRKAPHGLPSSRLVSTIRFDAWMQREHPRNPFARYADDAVAHCRSESEAKALLADIAGRLRECKLEIHPEKSGVVYCQDDNRRRYYPRIQFTFLGFTFRPRQAQGRNGRSWTAFLPAVSAAAMQQMYQDIREWKLPRQTSIGLSELATRYNTTLRGWLNYYGRFYRSALWRIFYHFDQRLLRWARRKYRKLAVSACRCRRWLKNMKYRQPRLFIHWLAFGRVAARTMGAV